MCYNYISVDYIYSFVQVYRGKRPTEYGKQCGINIGSLESFHAVDIAASPSFIGDVLAYMYLDIYTLKHAR